jgi:membrane protease YdiL (CAAX protease family)
MKNQSVGVEIRKQTPLVSWVKCHEVALFFAITFLITWTILTVLNWLELDNPKTETRLLLIGAFGPSMATFILLRITKPDLWKNVTIKSAIRFLLFFAGAFGLEMLDHPIWDHTVDASLITVDIILGALVAVTLANLFNGIPGSLNIKSSNLKWRTWLLWAVIALAIWPLMILLANAIAGMIGLPISAKPVLPHLPLVFLIIEGFLWFLLFGGPLNEEPGWRGFALPRLQEKYSPLIASIIVGFFWGLWHVPEHFMGVYGGSPLDAVIRLQDIPRAILFTWIYNRTRGSLLIMLLLHAAINTTTMFIPRSYHVLFVLCFVVAIVVVFVDKMWLKMKQV